MGEEHLSSAPEWGWVELGPSAFGLERQGRLFAVVYREEPDVGEADSPDGEPVVMDAGYYLVDTAESRDHVHLAEGSADWEDVRLRATRMFFGHREQA